MPSLSNRSTPITRLLLAAGGSFGVGLILIFYGIVADPFSLPFQDWNLMPADQQADYLAQAGRAQVVRFVGAIALALGMLLGALAVRQYVRRQPPAARDK